MPDLASVARTGDRLKTLEALRDYLASALDATASGRDQASLSARLTDVLLQIEEIHAPSKKEDGLVSLVALPGGSRAG